MFDRRKSQLIDLGVVLFGLLLVVSGVRLVYFSYLNARAGYQVVAITCPCGGMPTYAGGAVLLGLGLLIFFFRFRRG